MVRQARSEAPSPRSRCASRIPCEQERFFHDTFSTQRRSGFVGYLTAHAAMSSRFPVAPLSGGALGPAASPSAREGTPASRTNGCGRGRRAQGSLCVFVLAKKIDFETNAGLATAVQLESICMHALAHRMLTAALAESCGHHFSGFFQRSNLRLRRGNGSPIRWRRTRGSWIRCSRGWDSRSSPSRAGAPDDAAARGRCRCPDRCGCCGRWPAPPGSRPRLG